MANKSHTEIADSTEIWPSQMAFYMGSPEGEKLKENLIQNYTKYMG
jgi:hypothetical protein